MAKTGRNAPCPCGSGKKYKACCLDEDRAVRLAAEAHGTTFLTSGSERSAAQREAHEWPIVRAYVPVPDVWQATGLGTAAIVRRQPDGKSAYAMFPIKLLERGIDMLLGKHDLSEQELDEELADLRDVFPPFEEGPPELAADYIWGARAYGEAEGFRFPPSQEAPFLALVPRPPGSAQEWRERLVGRGGLAPPGLMRIVRQNAVETDLPGNMEVVVFTEMTFDLDDARAAAERVRTGAPDAQGYRFNEMDPDRDEVAAFDWVRPYPKGHWSPLRLLGGMQILGSVSITEGALVAEARTLSMAARLAGMLKARLGEGIRLQETRWSTPQELGATG